MASRIEIIAGEHTPDQPFMIVDRYGMHVDLTVVLGQLWDPNTIAKVEWGMFDAGGKTYGIVSYKNGERRPFWDESLMTPYLKAYNATKALNA